MSNRILQAENVKKSYVADSLVTEVLKGVSLSVDEGE